MTRRILLADEPSPMIDALRRDLEDRGLGVDVVAPAEAAGRATPGRYAAALAGGAARGTVAALKGADPDLPVVALFLDRKAAAASADAREADTVLVAPLTASGVAAVCELSARVRDLSARVAELEARAPRAGGATRDLDLLKRLLLSEVKRSRRYGHPLSLALVAIDGWEARAPRLSARARTAALAGVLGAVTDTLRDLDLAVPFSHERIVVVMPHTAAGGALRVARRLCAKVRDHRGQPGRVRVTASVGVASHDGDRTVSFAGLVKRAGEALARARAQGGDRAEAADPPERHDRISFG